MRECVNVGSGACVREYAFGNVRGWSLSSVPHSHTGGSHSSPPTTTTTMTSVRTELAFAAVACNRVANCAEWSLGRHASVARPTREGLVAFGAGCFVGLYDPEVRNGKPSGVGNGASILFPVRISRPIAPPSSGTCGHAQDAKLLATLVGHSGRVNSVAWLSALGASRPDPPTSSGKKCMFLSTRAIRHPFVAADRRGGWRDSGRDRTRLGRQRRTHPRLAQGAKDLCWVVATEGGSIKDGEVLSRPRCAPRQPLEPVPFARRPRRSRGSGPPLSAATPRPSRPSPRSTSRATTPT